MSFINSYKPPPSEADIDTSFTDPYDMNSSVPVPTILETSRVQLLPFIPSLHAAQIHKAIETKPELVHYMPFAWPTLRDLLVTIEKYLRQDPGCALFVLIDKTKPPLPQDDVQIKIDGRIAGMIGWIHGSTQNLSMEIGPVIVLPEFQRTFVAANAIGLLLQYALNLPAEGGLGFRRVAWTANPLNVPSVKVAEKMGFKQEGVKRWIWVLEEGKEGRPVVGEERGKGFGRDSIILSLCWDDWEGGVKQLVKRRMDQ